MRGANSAVVLNFFLKTFNTKLVNFVPCPLITGWVVIWPGRVSGYAGQIEEGSSMGAPIDGMKKKF